MGNSEGILQGKKYEKPMIDPYSLQTDFKIRKLYHSNKIHSIGVLLSNDNLQKHQREIAEKSTVLSTSRISSVKSHRNIKLAQVYPFYEPTPPKDPLFLKNEQNLSIKTYFTFQKFKLTHQKH
jgi:hypothetical protein